MGRCCLAQTLPLALDGTNAMRSQELQPSRYRAFIHIHFTSLVCTAASGSVRAHPLSNAPIAFTRAHPAPCAIPRYSALFSVSPLFTSAHLVAHVVEGGRSGRSVQGLLLLAVPNPAVLL